MVRNGDTRLCTLTPSLPLPQGKQTCRKGALEQPIRDAVYFQVLTALTADPPPAPQSLILPQAHLLAVYILRDHSRQPMAWPLREAARQPTEQPLPSCPESSSTALGIRKPAPCIGLLPLVTFGIQEFDLFEMGLPSWLRFPMLKQFACLKSPE